MELDEFSEKLLKEFQIYLENMRLLKPSTMSFPEWYEDFGRWLEVGTDMEYVYHGKRDSARSTTS